MKELKSNMEITKFIGANISELRSIVKRLTDNQKTLTIVKNESNRIVSNILSKDQYLDEDGTRILDAKYELFISDNQFKEYLKKRIIEFTNSSVLKITHPDLTLDDYNKCITWQYESVVIGTEKELINKMSVVLGFDSNDLTNLKTRKQAIEIIIGLVRTWKGY